MWYVGMDVHLKSSSAGVPERAIERLGRLWATGFVYRFARSHYHYGDAGRRMALQGSKPEPTTVPNDSEVARNRAVIPALIKAMPCSSQKKIRTPASKVIECCIDGRALYVGSTAKVDLGTLQQLLRRGGIGTEFLAPWLEKGLPEEFSDLPETMDPAASIYGCRFLRKLIGDPEFLVEPENGYVRLAADDTRITLSGAVLNDLHRYLKENVDVLGAKLLHGETLFTLDATTFRLSGIRLPRPKNQHWTDNLDQRLEQIEELLGKLDERFDKLM